MGGDEKIVRAADIDPEDREYIEDLLEGGALPKHVHKEMPHIPTRIIRNIRQTLRRNGEVDEEETVAPTMPEVKIKPPIMTTNSFDLLSQAMQMRKDQIAMEMLEEQIVQMREDSAHRRKTREIELRLKELEIREREAELEEDFEDETPVHSAQAPPDLFPNMARNSEYGWVLDIIQFANNLKNQSPRPVAPQPTMPPPPPPTDFSKPLSVDQVRAELSKFSSSQIAMVAGLPEGVFESELKKRYPNITPENINTIVTEVRRHGNNAQ